MINKHVAIPCDKCSTELSRYVSCPCSNYRLVSLEAHKNPFQAGQTSLVCVIAHLAAAENKW